MGKQASNGMKPTDVGIGMHSKGQLGCSKLRNSVQSVARWLSHKRLKGEATGFLYGLEDLVSNISGRAAKQVCKLNNEGAPFGTTKACPVAKFAKPSSVGVSFQAICTIDGPFHTFVDLAMAAFIVHEQ